MTLKIDRAVVIETYISDKGVAYLELADGGEGRLKLAVPNYHPEEWPPLVPISVVARVTPRIFGRDQSIRVDQCQVERLEIA